MLKISYPCHALAWSVCLSQGCTGGAGVEGDGGGRCSGYSCAGVGLVIVVLVLQLVLVVMKMVVVVVVVIVVLVLYLWKGCLYYRWLWRSW